MQKEGLSLEGSLNSSRPMLGLTLVSKAFCKRAFFHVRTYVRTYILYLARFVRILCTYLIVLREGMRRPQGHKERYRTCFFAVSSPSLPNSPKPTCSMLDSRSSKANAGRPPWDRGSDDSSSFPRAEVKLSFMIDRL